MNVSEISERKTRNNYLELKCFYLKAWLLSILVSACKFKVTYMWVSKCDSLVAGPIQK